MKKIRPNRTKECIGYLAKRGIPTPIAIGGGSILSDTGILRRLTPFEGSARQAQITLLQTGRLLVWPVPKAVTEASLDLHLGSTITDPGLTGSLTDANGIVLSPGTGLALHEPVFIKPGGFILASTLEQVGIPIDLLMQMFTCSKMAQLGLWCHSLNSQLGDPGYVGHLVMEIHNLSQYPVELRPGMKLLKAVFHLLDQPAATPYYAKRHIESDSPLKHPS